MSAGAGACVSVFLGLSSDVNAALRQVDTGRMIFFKQSLVWFLSVNYCPK